MMSVLFCYSYADSSKKVFCDEHQNLKIDTVIIYHPEKYKEEITDTIVDTDKKLRVVVKKTTRMDKFVIQEYELDSLHFQRIIYRDQTLEFKVIENNKVIFDKAITKEKLTQIKDKDFLSKSVMYGAWFDKYDKEKQEIEMSFNIMVPETDWAYHYIITVDKSGNGKIEEQIETHDDW